MSDVPSDPGDNPMLARGGLPAFDRIEPSHVVPGTRALLKAASAELDRLEATLEPTWGGLVEAIEQITDRFDFSWGIVTHLLSVKNSETLREAHDTVQGEVVEFYLRLGQSRKILRGLEALRDGAAWSGLEPAQRRIVELLLRDARHAGVGLEGAERQRFNEIERMLAEARTRFGNNLLDATKEFSLTLRDEEQVEGLPPSALQLAAQYARTAGEKDADAETGPWRITLDPPALMPFLEHGRCRELREHLYRAYVTRASAGKLDNTPLIERLLKLRREQARLLGFETYAELSLDDKMAASVEEVERLFEELRGVSFEAAHADLHALDACAREAGAAEADDIRHWDIAFWAERLRERRFSYSEEELRPYFQLPRVLEGLFAMARRLFEVQIMAADGEVPVWHEDVRFFRVHDADGEEIAAFYLDPYSRPGEKRGGAWMNDCVGRSRLLAGPGRAVRLPVAYLVCNQMPPVGDRPSLMSFSEVSTLFHEFGHGLQHMLTKVDYGLASGIRYVEWDAVELPSQFMENWLYHRPTVREISAHVDTGESLPDELFDKILQARTYRAGSKIIRQIYFGRTDMELHHRFDSDGSETPFDVMRRVAEGTTVLPPLPEDRFLCGFSHIFQGGYSAGYYGYQWAEVLSADAFGAFEKAGLDDDEAVAATGRRYRDTILALGGSRPPMEVFRAFRGREPSTEALLRHQGLLAASSGGRGS